MYEINKNSMCALSSSGNPPEGQRDPVASLSLWQKLEERGRHEGLK